MALLTMVHSHNNSGGTQHDLKPVLRDFLGMKPSLSPSSAAPPAPFSSTSEIASETWSKLSDTISNVEVHVISNHTIITVRCGCRNYRISNIAVADRNLKTMVNTLFMVSNHLEGVPYYGPRTDFSATEISNRLVGNKRSNSDSSFIGSSRDAFQMVPDSFQNSHLMKVLRHVSGGERSRRPNDDEVLLGMQSMKPSSSSQIFHPPTSTMIDASKWDRSILMNAGPSMQHLPRGGQMSPFAHQLASTSNKIRDTNVGPSFISQFAADEGSRTGIKGPGVLSSINTSATASDKISSSVLLGGSRPKPLTNIIESSTPPSSHHGLTPASRQMTIFYGGQAHVFDDVHPHKADVIMALAGSNGGSWSTAFSPKSTAKLVNDSNLHSGENEAGLMNNVPFPQELHGKLPVTGSSSRAVGPGDRVSTPTGAHQGSIFPKDTRNSIQAADPSSEDKRAL